MKKRKKLYALAGLGLCFLLAAGMAGRYFMAAAKKTAHSYREIKLQHGDLQMTFTGEGTASEGIISQKPDFNAEVMDFIVEKTYVSSGDAVKKGDALYKMSDESISKAIAYCEEAIEKATKELNRANTAYEAGKAKAEYERDKSKATAESAKEVCDAKNRSKDQEVAEAEAALSEAQTKISMYQTNLEQNQYYIDANVSEKKKNYELAKKSGEQAKKASQQAKAAYNDAVLAVGAKIAELQQSASDLQTLVAGIAELKKLNKKLTEKRMRAKRGKMH